MGLIFCTCVFSACSVRYGSISKNTLVFKQFKIGKALENYTYYIKGHMINPYAIIGIKPEYFFDSKNWQQVNLEKIALKTLVFRSFKTTSGYHYSAKILNHKREEIGVILTNAFEVKVIMGENNQINQIAVFEATRFL